MATAKTAAKAKTAPMKARRVAAEPVIEDRPTKSPKLVTRKAAPAPKAKIANGADPYDKSDREPKGKIATVLKLLKRVDKKGNPIGATIAEIQDAVKWRLSAKGTPDAARSSLWHVRKYGFVVEKLEKVKGEDQAFFVDA